MARPTAGEQLVLLGAGTSVRREAMAERAYDLAAEVNWSRLTETLGTRKLLPPLGPRIIELARGRASEGFCSAVAAAIDAGRRQGTLLQLISLRIMTMLADAGISSTPLKGPMLGEAIYGDPGRRLSSDIDLLVAPESLSAAVEVVRELGYAPPTDHVQADGMPLLHFVLEHERGELPPVELHWRVHWYERSFARERLLPPARDLPDGWRPARADELAALLLFYARDGFLGLRLVSDVSAWWDVYGGELPVGAMGELADDYPALARVITAATNAAEKMVGLPGERVLSGTHRPSVRERVAVRLADSNPQSSESQLYADMGLVDGLLAPPGGFGPFVRRQLLPPSQVLDQQARHGARRRARAPLARFMGVLGRYGLTMTRLALGPRTLS
jgi:Uncharacterised nucleotidyltransferase